MATQGNAVPLNYGLNWITGQKLDGITLQNTGSIHLDWTRVGFWLLGEGQMDGLVELWDSALGVLYYQSEFDNPSEFHFHPGGDAVAGSGFALTSQGTDQAVDKFWQYLPSGLQPLHYNRWAYYAIQKKQVVNGLTTNNPNQETASNWADINPIGLWRGLRCRLFSTTGSMIGYGFTRNPAWHFVDLICRRKLDPEFLLPLNGAEDLPASVKARFDWGAIAETAAYFGEIQPNGMPRFAGDYSFNQKTTLQACLTQILTSSRSFIRERSGQFSIVADKPRASVFTFSRSNADTPTETDADVHSAPNLYNGKFRDLLVPACAEIQSLTASGNQATITTVLPHPIAANDYIVIGNTGTPYDTNWQVLSTPLPDANGNVYQLTISNVGSNYPSSLGEGGLIGLRFSRFKDRSPQFEHHAHQLAVGGSGVGIQRYRNRRSVDTDFANCTWDQVARVSYWQRIVALGPDAQPYITPPRLSLRSLIFSPDAAGSGAIALQIEPGDHVTIDDTLSSAYAGEYEVTQAPTTLTAGSGEAGGALQSGSIQFTLRPYSDGNYPDVSPVDQPGVPDVPGLPGNEALGTAVPLSDGGSFSFFTGSGASGSSFQLPDGYAEANLMTWASPQGFVQSNLHMHFVYDCDASNRKLLMQYSDGSDTPWTGDANFAGVAWNATTSANVSTQALQPPGSNITFVELTLAGGELVLFAKGYYQSSGTEVVLPAGYSWANAIALGFPWQGTDDDHPAHGFEAHVGPDASTDGQKIGSYYHDGSGNTWTGKTVLFLFAWKDNLSTWKASGNGWFSCPLPNGQILAVMGASILDVSCNGVTPTVYAQTGLYQVLTGGKIPTFAGLPATTLQTMTGPNGFEITGNDAHGVRLCTVDLAGNATCTFEDGEGNVWQGSSGVFGLLCDTPPAVNST